MYEDVSNLNHIERKNYFTGDIRTKPKRSYHSSVSSRSPSRLADDERGSLKRDRSRHKKKKKKEKKSKKKHRSKSKRAKSKRAKSSKRTRKEGSDHSSLDDSKNLNG